MGPAPRIRPSSPAPPGWVPSAPMARWLVAHGVTTEPVDGLPCLFPDDIAALTTLAGQPIEVISVHRFNYNGKKHRKARKPPVPSDLPAPAGHHSRKREWPQRSGPPSPYWWPWQIDPWLGNRRGPGNPRPRAYSTRTTLTEGARTDDNSQQAAS